MGWSFTTHQGHGGRMIGGAADKIWLGNRDKKHHKWFCYGIEV
jgi:hypothetical protein